MSEEKVLVSLIGLLSVLLLAAAVWSQPSVVTIAAGETISVRLTSTTPCSNAWFFPPENCDRHALGLVIGEDTGTWVGVDMPEGSLTEMTVEMAKPRSNDTE